MKNVNMTFLKFIFVLVVVTLAYTIYAIERDRFSDSIDTTCALFEEKVQAIVNNNGLKFSDSFHYREKHYQKLAIIYSSEYGLGSDIACYYERDSHKVTAYFRKGAAENSILSNDKYFAFYIARQAKHANDYKVYWKLTE